MLNEKYINNKNHIFDLLPRLDLYENCFKNEVNYFENLYPEIYNDIGKYFEEKYIKEKENVKFTRKEINDINNQIFNQMTENKKLEKLSQDLLHDIIQIIIVDKLNCLK